MNSSPTGPAQTRLELVSNFAHVLDDLDVQTDTEQMQEGQVTELDVVKFGSIKVITQFSDANFLLLYLSLHSLAQLTPTCTIILPSSGIILIKGNMH